MARRHILAEVIVALQDRFSGRATAIVRSGNSVLAMLDRFNKVNVGTIGQIGPGLTTAARSMDRMAASAGRLSAPLRQATDRLGALRAQAAAPIALNFTVNRAGLDRATADLRRARQEAQRPIVAAPAGPGGTVPQQGPGRRYYGGGYGSIVAGSVMASRSQQGSRWSIQQGADQQREDARAMVAGIPPDARAVILRSAAELSRQFPSIRQAAAQEVLRETFFSSGGPRRGGLANMQSLAPDLGAAFVNLQNKVGPRGAIDQLTGFARAGQNLGFADDVPRMRQLLDALVRAQAVEGKEFNFRDLFTFARRSKSAGLSLSDDFLMSVAPALIADMTPATAGVALGTLLSRQTAGQNSRAADAAQREYGIRNDQGLVNNTTLVRNPLQWIEQTLIPALQAKGVNVADPAQLGQVLPKLFRDQTAQGLVTRMILQMDEFKDAIEAYRNAMPSRQAADALRSQDPYVALAGATAQAANAMAEVSKPVIEVFIPALHKAAEVLNGFGAWMRANPTLAPYVSGAAVVGVGGAALAGTILTLRGIGAALGLGGAGVAGGAASGLGGGIIGGAARLIPGIGLLIGGYGGARAAGGAIDAVAGAAEGRHYTPRSEDDLAILRQRAAELETEIARIKAATHPSMQGQPNASLANLESELANLRNRIALGLQQAGTEIGQGVARGAQSATPAAEAAGASIGEAIARAARQSATGATGAPATTPPAAPGRASGGPVSAGRLYRVGEAGEELFVPGANGSIIPNHASAGQGRRLTIAGPLIGSVNITGASADEILSRLADKVREAATGAFSDAELTWG